ncbi:MAG: hypothetical protein AMXMBFR47_17300 [Planctomycetota bacterium]
MTRDEFEFLLSQWLDEPDRADLVAAVAEAVAAAPELATVRDEWMQFDRATRKAVVQLPQIDWQRQAEHIRTMLVSGDETAEQTDARLDNLLNALPSPAVDWERLRGRIASAAHGTRRGRRSYRAAWTAALTAAAAIVAFIVLRPLMPGGVQPPPAMVAAAVVQRSSPVAFGGSTQVHVTVGRVAGESQASPEPAVESEFFLMIDPAPSESATRTSTIANENEPRLARADGPRATID